MRASRIIGIILAVGLALDLLSIIGWSVPVWSAPITAALLVVVATLTLIDVRLGVVAVLLELLWGSHGYLLKIPAGGLNVSLRMGIFLVVLGATVWHFHQRDARAVLWQTFRSHPVRWPALVFLATLALGLVLGFLRHSFDLVFFDANTWGMLLLAPAFLLAKTRMTRISRTDDTDTRMFEIAFLVGAGYLVLRTYLLLFVFSHDLGGFWLAAYQWVRDTRLGEVTIFPGAFPRVFLPSMVLLFPAIAIAISRIRELGRGYADTRMPYISEGETTKNFSPSFRGGARGGVVQDFGRSKGRLLPTIVFGGSVAVLLLSLSRSYWLALVALTAIGSLWVIVRALRQNFHSHFRTKMRMKTRSVSALIASVGVAVVFAVAVVRLPYPKPLTTAGVGETLLARLSADAAVSNRWQQIGPLRDAILQHPILGNGFGAAVTYETRDPRTLAAYSDGKYTTTAFEWGYLDDLLERGLLGLLTELWLLATLVWHGLRRSISPPLSEGERRVLRSFTASFRSLVRRRSEGGEGVGAGSARGWGSERSALALGLLAIAIVHATSPYLNHPLGIGLLLWLFAMEAPRPPEEKRGAVVTK